MSQTPTFLIGDKLIPGAIPFDMFKKLVDAELAKHPAAAGATVDSSNADAKKPATLAPTTKGK